MMPSCSVRFAATISIACLASVLAIAQVPPSTPTAPGKPPVQPLTKAPPIPTDAGKLSMKATVGSFKMVSRSDQDEIKGRLEISFTGTVLISGLAKGGMVKTSGAVHQEYDDPKHLKSVYFGTGKIVLDGTVRSVQWFGQDLQGTFAGRGLVRFYGEFDRSGNTGFFWYGAPADAKAKRFAWGTYGIQVEVPEPNRIQTIETVPTPRKAGG